MVRRGKQRGGANSRRPTDSRRQVRERRLATKLIGVGGIFTAAHVCEYLAAGAESVQLATAAMLDPLVGCSIRGDLAQTPRSRPD